MEFDNISILSIVLLLVAVFAISNFIETNAVTKYYE